MISVSLGEEKATKTGANRAVDLLTPLASDLKELRMRLGRPGDEDYIFPRADGQPWRETDWRNWRKRVFAPAAERAELAGIRPYDLRHSFASLLLHEGKSVVEVGEQLGNQPSVAADTYGHVIRELRGAKRVPAEQAIRQSRAPSVHPRKSERFSKENGIPLVARLS